VKVLVVGSLPPPEVARAKALRIEVTRLLTEGHTIEVVAPSPLATAHRYLIRGGIPGCMRLARMIEGYDAVVVQLEPGLPVRSRAGGLERRLSLLAFAFALRHGRDVVIRIECLADLPGGPGGGEALRVWRSAGSILLANDQERAAFVAAVGGAGESLPVSSPHDREVADNEADEGGWGDGADVSAESVLELVRVRAARDRRHLSEFEPGRVAGWDRLPVSRIATLEAVSVAARTVHAQRKLARIARCALWAADSRPMLRPAATAVRAVRRGAYAVIRPDRSD